MAEACISKDTLRWEIYTQPQPYTKILKRQHLLHDQVAQGLPPTVLVCQHLPVVTLGRRWRSEHLPMPVERLEAEGISGHKVPRGGSVTAHEPGQLVLYPILPLRRMQLRVRTFVDKLVGCLVQVGLALDVPCADRPQNAIPLPKGIHPTGVWVANRKCASVGIQVQRGVSLHGAALNVNNDGSLFAKIVPCGLPQVKMTSLAQELGIVLDMDRVVELVKDCFSREFF